MKQKSNYLIALTGGHLAPAEAVAEFIQKTAPDIELNFFSRKKTFTTKEFQADSVESKVMQPYTKRIVELPIERLSLSPLTWINFGFSILIAMRHFLTQRPDCVVSFGGYAAVPVSIAAVLCKIPLLIHEQSHVLGASNRLLAKFASKVCVSYRELVSGKLVYTGFPLRVQILNPPEKLSFPILKELPILYITGGTTGAVAINKLIQPLIPKLVENWTIIHQTGKLSLAECLKLKQNLKVSEQNRYIPLEYVSGSDVSFLLHHANCVVSRSGANTVYELAYTKTPSILIPLETSSNHEQAQNALWLDKFAPTKILNQKNAQPEDILKAISSMEHNKIANNKFEVLPTNGVENIVYEIRTLLK